ncbi:hypothetical protein [Zoogloea sp. LCSB751]|uniref:hypothetical protein n=1 Tax=Zoogloea sp. LCSB751 TaxID=1965277 RepID=UPI000B4969E2|nr:hypothetical protein [Zoogloea sp. LCSB751]
MDLQNQFRDDELEKIVDEAALYMCACPGQVAAELFHLRDLIRYQRRCLESSDTAPIVHRTIADAAVQAHQLMEDCLRQVLELEGWDRETLSMPAGLRERRDALIARDD